MKTKLLLFLIVTCGTAKAQLQLREPLSTIAFDSLIIRDLNFIVIGENNPKQGITFEYKEKNTELALSGIIASKPRSILTIDGQFTVDDGAFVFDTDKAAKKGKLTFNWFINWAWLNFKSYRLNTDKAKHIKEVTATRRALLYNDLERREFASTTLKDYMELHSIMQILNLPTHDILTEDFEDAINLMHDITEDDISLIIANYQATNARSIAKRIKKYLPKMDGIESSNLQTIVYNIGTATNTKSYQFQMNDISTPDDKDDLITVIYKVPIQLETTLLIKDYNEAYKNFEKYVSKNNTQEITNFQPYWTSHGNGYVNISPFYEREGFDLYQSSSDTLLPFGDRFRGITGDLYGVNLNLNYVYMTKKRSFVIGRFVNTIARGSNFSEFSKKEYSLTTNGDTVNATPIQVTDKKIGYTNKNSVPYDYGSVFQTGIELYASFPIIGAYGKIGYRKNEALQLMETYPMETGVMFNIRSKEKKNIISLLLFVNRRDLNVHPDEDMTFGFKVGLPINLPSK